MTKPMTRAKSRLEPDKLFEDRPPELLLMQLERGGKIIRLVRKREKAARWRAATAKRGLKP